MATLTPAQLKKQKEALKKHHEDGKAGLANTSANSPRGSRALINISRSISDLTPSAAEIIKKAINGGLVPEMEVWQGTEEEKSEILHKNTSARFEIVRVEQDVFDDNGRLVSPAIDVEVIIRYVTVSKNRAEIAKWVVTKDAELKKAIEDSKLRKIELAMKQKKAIDDGAVPSVDPVARAKEAASKGTHLQPVSNFSLEIEGEFEDEDE